MCIRDSYQPSQLLLASQWIDFTICNWKTTKVIKYVNLLYQCSNVFYTVFQHQQVVQKGVLINASQTQLVQIFSAVAALLIKPQTEWRPTGASPTPASSPTSWSTCWKTHPRASLWVSDLVGLGRDPRLYISPVTQRWYWCYWSSDQTFKLLPRISLETGIRSHTKRIFFKRKL